MEIITGERQPGGRIVELEVASIMATSQGPVREALQRLEREGLVDRQARSATLVTPVSQDTMRELFTIRSLIEGFAVRRTADCINAEQLELLERLIDQMRAAGSRGDLYALTQFDMHFHRCLVEWSSSPALLRAWNPLYSQIQRFVVQTHPRYFGSLQDIAGTHAPIIAALGRHDVDAAANAVQEHVMLIWKKMEQAVKSGA